MVNLGLITWEDCKNHPEIDTRDKEQKELLILSASVEIKIYTDRNMFEREIRELHDGYLQKELNYTSTRFGLSLLEESLEERGAFYQQPCNK